MVKIDLIGDMKERNLIHDYVNESVDSARFFSNYQARTHYTSSVHLKGHAVKTKGIIKCGIIISIRSGNIPCFNKKTNKWTKHLWTFFLYFDVRNHFSKFSNNWSWKSCIVHVSISKRVYAIFTALVRGRSTLWEAKMSCQSITLIYW